MLTAPPLTVHLAETKTFPTLRTSTGPVDATRHIERGTSTAVVLAYLVGTLVIMIGGLVSYGILWLVLLFAPLANYFNRKRIMALIKGSALEVGPAQFPEIHQCAVTLAQLLGLRTVPQIYILEGNTINAAALRVTGQKVIVLQDDLVDACLRSGDIQTLTFILGHEMAHHALGHTGLIRSGLTKVFKKLSRLDEFSCDAVANELVGDLNVSTRAIALLVTGPQLMPYLNLNALIAQAHEVKADKHTKKAENKLTHPLLLRRLERFVP